MFQQTNKNLIDTNIKNIEYIVDNNSKKFYILSITIFLLTILYN